MTKNQCLNTIHYFPKEFGIGGDLGDIEDKAQELYKKMLTDKDMWAWKRIEELYLSLPKPIKWEGGNWICQICGGIRGTINRDTCKCLLPKTPKL